MGLDLIPVSGVVLSTITLLCGAYLVLMETEPVLRLFGKKSASPLHLSETDLRLIARLAGAGPDGHALSGNAVMDTQHQCLFENASSLRAAILSGRTADEVGVTIDTLVRDVVKHFQDEEAVLAATNYPGTAKHAALHRELAKYATTLVEQFRVGALGIGELFQFLAHTILTKHTSEADGDFMLFLEGRG